MMPSASAPAIRPDGIIDCKVLFYRGSMNNSVCDWNVLGEVHEAGLHVEER